MKKIIDIIVKIVLYIWQLPQNILGFLLRKLYSAERMVIKDIVVYYSKSFLGGISLGDTIIVGSKNESMAMHEHGHQFQSLYLGPLYLLVIGIPSFIWAALYGPIIPYKHNRYYTFYTERWADKLGGVIRK